MVRLRMAISAGVLLAGLWLLAPTALGSNSAWDSLLPTRTLQLGPELDSERLWVEFTVAPQPGQSEAEAVAATFARFDAPTRHDELWMSDLQHLGGTTMQARPEVLRPPLPTTSLCGGPDHRLYPDYGFVPDAVVVADWLETGAQQ